MKISLFIIRRELKVTVLRDCHKTHKEAAKITYTWSLESFEALQLSSHCNQSNHEEKGGILMSVHTRIRRQILLRSITKKKWSLDSIPMLHNGHIIEKISSPRKERFKRVCNLSRMRCQMKTFTLRGKTLDHLVLGLNKGSKLLSIWDLVAWAVKWCEDCGLTKGFTPQGILKSFYNPPGILRDRCSVV